jgi:hypothetical protein
MRMMIMLWIILYSACQVSLVVLANATWDKSKIGRPKIGVTRVLELYGVYRPFIE